MQRRGRVRQTWHCLWFPFCTPKNTDRHCRLDQRGSDSHPSPRAWPDEPGRENQCVRTPIFIWIFHSNSLPRSIHFCWVLVLTEYSNHCSFAPTSSVCYCLYRELARCVSQPAVPGAVFENIGTHTTFSLVPINTIITLETWCLLSFKILISEKQSRAQTF